MLIAAIAISVVIPAVAQPPSPTEVSLLSASPATASGDGDWCIAATGAVTLTAHVVELSTSSEVAVGEIIWQFCANPALGGLAKEECERGGMGRWIGEIRSFLDFDATPSLSPNPQVPILGVRLQYRPAPTSGLKKDLSLGFNLDRTC
jgi:hypothetical protein